MRGKIAMAVTGASGVVYGLRMAEWLVQNSRSFYFMVSPKGRIVLKEEVGLDLKEGREEALLRKRFRDKKGFLTFLDEDDLLAPPASGSSQCPAFVVVPCSMGTLGRIAAGISSNLIERTADVMLKEGRKLILVPRETPLNAIHLENMLRLSHAGAHIIPAMPGFYHHPMKLDDLVDFVVGKILDILGINHDLFERWEGKKKR